MAETYPTIKASISRCIGRARQLQRLPKAEGCPPAELPRDVGADVGADAGGVSCRAQSSHVTSGCSPF